MNKYKFRELLKQIISKDKFAELEKEDKSISQIFLLLGKIILDFLLSFSRLLYQFLIILTQTFIFVGKWMGSFFIEESKLIGVKK